MSVTAQYGLRTFSRLGISRYATVSNAIVKIPMPVIVSPGTLTIKMNENLPELQDKNCIGQTVVAFTYTEEIKPEINIAFSVAAPEFDTFTHGRLMTPTTSYTQGFTYFEITANKTTFPARTTGQTGFGVAAQAANANPEIYYIDPVTKLAKVIAIIATTGTPTGDQMIIDANLEIELSPELAATGARIEGWLPVTLSTATIISSTLLDTFEVKAQGIDFNGKVALFRARNCSRLAGGDITATPERSANIRILPDPNDGTGLGFQMIYSNLSVVC